MVVVIEAFVEDVHEPHLDEVLRVWAKAVRVLQHKLEHIDHLGE